LSEALTALRAQPAGIFVPFTSSNALALSDVPVCADWPFIPGAPEVDAAPLPNVPTLILSGADDLRTPTANARAVAAQIPDAHLLVVPNTGHSVLSSDPTSCAHSALQALFAGKPVRQCKGERPPDLSLPTPLPPRSLREVRPAPGEHGVAGRAVDAVVLTLGDFDRQMVLALLEHVGESLLGLASVRTGGLRTGWGGTVHSGLVLHNYSYVPGVAVSGMVSSGGAVLRIGGSAAVHGSIRIDAHGTLTGALGGQHVHIRAPGPAEPGLSGPASVVQSRLSALLASPRRLADLRAGGAPALLRYMLGAHS
jgi:hypothetical protein